MDHCKSDTVIRAGDFSHDFSLLSIFALSLFQVAHKIATMSDATALIILKLDFMRILASHEHYLTLNLPFTTLVASPLDPMSLHSVTSSLAMQSYTVTTELTNDFRQQHFLVGIILCDLVTALNTRWVGLHTRWAGLQAR